jgi:hypothetical protein
MLSTPPATYTSPSPAITARAGVGGRAHPRRAQAVDRLAGHGDGQPREQRGHARDVAVVLARLVGAAEHHVGHARRVEPGVAREQGADAVGGEVVGARLGERAADAADRRAHAVDEVCGSGHRNGSGVPAGP